MYFLIPPFIEQTNESFIIENDIMFIYIPFHINNSFNDFLIKTILMNLFNRDNLNEPILSNHLIYLFNQNIFNEPFNQNIFHESF